MPKHYKDHGLQEKGFGRYKKIDLSDDDLQKIRHERGDAACLHDIVYFIDWYCYDKKFCSLCNKELDILGVG